MSSQPNIAPAGTTSLIKKPSFLSWWLCSGLFWLLVSEVVRAEQPNIIVIMADDQGYNDLGGYGSEKIKTPRIDQMAADGMRLTSFYAAAPLCGPSRAGLLTGCYSQRLAELNGEKEYHTVIDSSEVLIPEMLKTVGYATAVIGKWHVAGNGKRAVSTDSEKSGLARFALVHEEIMPCQKGADYYFGIPYSNDMSPTVLMRNNEFVESLGKGERQRGISTRYTDEALGFIEANQKKPFFIYLAHTMPHTPLWPSLDFEGKSEYGLYGDCIEEIDWNVGRVLDKLKELKIDENTLVIYTSDNGPWYEPARDHLIDAPKSRLQSGTAAPLRGYKMSTHDGGSRVPCVIRFPGQIKSGQVRDDLVSALDFFPTFAKLSGAKLSGGRVLDGVDITEFLSGKSEQSPREDYYYYKWTHLHAIRVQDWKLVLPREAHPEELGWYQRLQESVEEITLYDLKADIGETTNVAEQHPEVVAQLMKIVEKAQADLGDGSRGIKGSGVRKAPQER